MLRVLICTLAALAASTTQTSAQQISVAPTPSVGAAASGQSFVVDFQDVADARPTPAMSLFALGLIGSVAGGYGGGWMGYRLDRARDVPSEDPGLMGAILGALTGSIAGTTIAVHLADRRRGPAGQKLLGALVGTAAGLAFAAAADNGNFALPAIAVGQASFAVALGRIGAAGPRRDESDRYSK
jgi:hypothetical protein